MPNPGGYDMNTTNSPSSAAAFDQSQSAAICFDAQTSLGTANEYNNGQLNPDVGGACNAIANIIINLLLPFLVAWSPDVSTSIFLLLSQTIPTLISTLSSIHSSNLSLFDSHFTVAVTASPLSIYVAASCILHFFHVETSIFKKIVSSEARTLILILGLLLPWLWLSVSLTTSFSTDAFRNSIYCEGMIIPRFMEFLLISSFTGVLDVLGRRDLWDDLSKRWGLGLVSLIGLWVWAVYLVRHREEIVRECRQPMYDIMASGASSSSLDISSGHSKFHTEMRIFHGLPPAKRAQLVGQYFLLIWRIPKVSWDVIISKHPAMLAWMLICFHWSWVLGISKALVFDRSQLSYGQVLSLFAPLPCIWSFAKIIVEHRIGIKRAVQQIPTFISKEICFIATGRNEWRASSEVMDRDYFHWTRQRWALTLVACFAWIGGHIVWIIFYIHTGTVPNDRNVTNDPHRNWKPYSVCMFINGYITSVLSMFLCVAYADFRQRMRSAKSSNPTQRSTPRTALRALYFTLGLILAVMICAGGLFSPYAGLPLSQQWHWNHLCDYYPAEVVLTGKADYTVPSQLSVYVTRADSIGYPPQRDLLYQYAFTNAPSNPTLNVLQLVSSPAAIGVDTPPVIKTLVLDTVQQRFCSSNDAHDLTNPADLDAFLAQCSQDSGTYVEHPYLSFAITSDDPESPNDPPALTYLRAESKEYAYVDDAPSFSLRFSSADGKTLNSILLRSALTKRNYPEVLKVCSNAVVPFTEVLGPLSVVMVALDRFSVFITRPRVY